MPHVEVAKLGVNAEMPVCNWEEPRSEMSGRAIWIQYGAMSKEFTEVLLLNGIRPGDMQHQGLEVLEFLEETELFYVGNRETVATERVNQTGLDRPSGRKRPAPRQRPCVVNILPAKRVSANPSRNLPHSLQGSGTAARDGYSTANDTGLLGGSDVGYEVVPARVSPDRRRIRTAFALASVLVVGAST